MTSFIYFLFILLWLSDDNSVILDYDPFFVVDEID